MTVAAVSTPGTAETASTMARKAAVCGPFCGVARFRQHEARGQHPVGIEAEGHPQQAIEGAQEEARAEQEEEGQRHLGADEQARASGGAPPRLPCRPPAGERPDRRAGRAGPAAGSCPDPPPRLSEEGEAEGTAGPRDVLRPRQGVGGGEQEQVPRPEREQDPQGPSEGGDDQALGQDLAAGSAPARPPAPAAPRTRPAAPWNGRGAGSTGSRWRAGPEGPPRPAGPRATAPPGRS